MTVVHFSTISVVDRRGIAAANLGVLFMMACLPWKSAGNKRS